jgi:hypothetical protein
MYEGETGLTAGGNQLIVRTRGEHTSRDTPLTSRDSLQRRYPLQWKDPIWYEG